jgi:mannosyltransferase OCH1-like enzyme
LPLYEAMPRNIMRADMIRYIILQSFGGLYLDLDYELFRPFDLLDETLVLPRQSGGEDVHLGNCILASEPGHPFWEAVLSEMETSVTALGRPPLEDEVIWLTGPGLLTRVYKKFSQTDPSICTPAGGRFHPPVPTNESEYEALRQTAAVYGVHHCDGTWRARTVGQRIGRKLSTLRARLQRRGAAPG